MDSCRAEGGQWPGLFRQGSDLKAPGSSAIKRSRKSLYNGCSQAVPSTSGERSGRKTTHVCSPVTCEQAIKLAAGSACGSWLTRDTEQQYTAAAPLPWKHAMHFRTSVSPRQASLPCSAAPQYPPRHTVMLGTPVSPRPTLHAHVRLNALLNAGLTSLGVWRRYTGRYPARCQKPSSGAVTPNDAPRYCSASGRRSARLI